MAGSLDLENKNSYYLHLPFIDVPATRGDVVWIFEFKGKQIMKVMQSNNSKTDFLPRLTTGAITSTVCGGGERCPGIGVNVAFTTRRLDTSCYFIGQITGKI